MSSFEQKIASGLGSLIVKLNRRIKQSLKYQFPPIINLTQLRILMIVKKNEASTANEIAEIFDITPASMATNVKYLTQNGLLNRAIDINDKRNQNLLLTKLGQVKLKETGVLIFKNILDTMHDKRVEEKEKLLSAIDILIKFIN